MFDGVLVIGMLLASLRRRPVRGLHSRAFIRQRLLVLRVIHGLHIEVRRIELLFVHRNIYTNNYIP